MVEFFWLILYSTHRNILANTGRCGDLGSLSVERPSALFFLFLFHSALLYLENKRNQPRMQPIVQLMMRR